MILFSKLKITLQNLILTLQCRSLSKKIKPQQLPAYCQDVLCPEPTKTKIGWGQRSLTKELIEKNIPKHFDLYTCEKYRNGECKGNCTP